jgi:hypothetical protein
MSLSASISSPFFTFFVDININFSPTLTKKDGKLSLNSPSDLSQLNVREEDNLNHESQTQDYDRIRRNANGLMLPHWLCSKRTFSVRLWYNGHTANPVVVSFLHLCKLFKSACENMRLLAK